MVDSSVDSSVDGLITAATAIVGAELVSRRARPLVRELLAARGLVAAGVAAAAWQRLIARRRARPSLLAEPARLSRLPTTDASWQQELPFYPTNAAFPRGRRRHRCQPRLGRG